MYFATEFPENLYRLKLNLLLCPKIACFEKFLSYFWQNRTKFRTIMAIIRRSQKKKNLLTKEFL